MQLNSPGIMKNSLAIFSFLFFYFCNIPVAAQNSGEDLFKANCATCHTVGGGRLVGPDLKGITEKKDVNWIRQFIHSSQKMVKSGDTAAVAIFSEFKIPMPDFPLPDEQVNAIIDYIKGSGQPQATAQAPPATKDTTAGAKKDTGAVAAVKPPAAPPDTTKYSPESAAHGRALFYGTVRFASGAAPCVSCHNIRDESVLGGGKLALDLTAAYSKLGPAGIQAIIMNPPFPVMKAALLKNPVDPSEVRDIISMLRSVDERNKNFTVRQAGGFIFFIIGLLTAMFLAVHIFLFYDNRKIKRSQSR